MPLAPPRCAPLTPPSARRPCPCARSGPPGQQAHLREYGRWGKALHWFRRMRIRCARAQGGESGDSARARRGAGGSCGGWRLLAWPPPLQPSPPHTRLRLLPHAPRSLAAHWSPFNSGLLAGEALTAPFFGAGRVQHARLPVCAEAAFPRSAT